MKYIILNVFSVSFQGDYSKIYCNSISEIWWNMSMAMDFFFFFLQIWIHTINHNNIKIMNFCCNNCFNLNKCIRDQPLVALFPVVNAPDQEVTHNKNETFYILEFGFNTD